MSKATTCDKELGCGNCNRKMTSQKWAKVKKNEDKQWGEEVKASKVGGGGVLRGYARRGGAGAAPRFRGARRTHLKRAVSAVTTCERDAACPISTG